MKDVVIVVLFGLGIMFAGELLKAKTPTYGPIYSGATTFIEPHTVSEPQTWTKTGDLHFPKYQDVSNMLFTCQITFVNSEPGPYGTMFKLRFRTEAGEYFAESPFTGQVSAHANAYQNAMLSDTIIDLRVMKEPPAGEYVAELWVFTGGGVLTVAPYATNIAVWEAPFFITPQ